MNAWARYHSRYHTGDDCTRRSKVSLITLLALFIRAISLSAMIFVGASNWWQAYAARTTAHTRARECAPRHRFLLTEDLGAFVGFTAVAVISPQDIWAATQRSASDAQAQPVIAHWDGKQWRLFPIPVVGRPAYLTSISATSADDVWVVGKAGLPPGQQPLVEHWDGTSWQLVASPTLRDGELAGVTAVSHANVWAVGDGSLTSSATEPLIEHWNGVRWSIATVERSPHRAVLYGVSATSAEDVWVVGENLDTTGTTLAEHWNGLRWQVVPSMSDDHVESAFRAVSAVTPAEVWAVGDSGNAVTPSKKLVERWDGTRWQIMPAFVYGPDSLDSVSASSAHDVWAAGVGQTVRWDGRLWHLIQLPSGDFANRVVSAAPGTVWLAGANMRSRRGGAVYAPVVEQISLALCKRA